MDDVTGRSSSVGPTTKQTTTSKPERARAAAARSGTAYVDDLTAEEMTTIIPIDEFEPAPWETDRRSRTYSPSRSEITQDILLPEGEFEQYQPDEPFDVDGARLDTYNLDSSGELRLPTAGRSRSAETAEKPFRTVDPKTSRQRGRHRVAAPPTALKGGRAALVAMAAGAAVAAAATAQGTSSETENVTTTAANVTDPAAGATTDLGPGVATANPSKDMSTFTDQLTVGKARADAKAAAAAAARRPMFESPIPLGHYDFTSGFANRWGSFHGGIDMAAPLGTPIHAAADGVVKEAGPASGYGNWIQVLSADGTITMYGHMASSGVLVQKGQRVTAGDVIGLVGNEGFSTGPHVHFEVWKNGTTKIDPAPWLAEHGVRLSNYTG